MSEITVLCPVLRRPHRVRPTITSAAPYPVLFIADPDDEMELVALESAGAHYIATGGSYAEKINKAALLNGFEGRYIFLGADDLAFHPGWGRRAIDKMTPQIRVVGTQDMCNPRTIAGHHATHFLVDRRYCEEGTIDESGKLLHEGYRHNFVDNEFIETARHRGVYAFADAAVVEHLHPLANKAPQDEVYALGRRHYREDRRLFERRRKLWR